MAQNANVEDIEILYLLHSNDYVYMPYHVSCENGVMTAQMIQQYHAVNCAKMQLSQSGRDRRISTKSGMRRILRDSKALRFARK